jgi:hypothetical protein
MALRMSPYHMLFASSLDYYANQFNFSVAIRRVLNIYLSSKHLEYNYQSTTHPNLNFIDGELLGGSLSKKLVFLMRT